MKKTQWNRGRRGAASWICSYIPEEARGKKSPGSNLSHTNRRDAISGKSAGTKTTRAAQKYEPSEMDSEQRSNLRERDGHAIIPAETEKTKPKEERPEKKSRIKEKKRTEKRYHLWNG